MHNEHPLISEIFYLQCLILGALLAFTVPIEAKNVGRSIIAGGLLHILPSVWHWYVVKNNFGVKSSHQFVNAMRRGQFIKFILTAILVIMITRLPYPLDYFIIFVTFTIMILGSLGLLAYVQSRQTDISVF